jgi:hypothetical protein
VIAQQATRLALTLGVVGLALTGCSTVHADASPAQSTTAATATSASSAPSSSASASSDAFPTGTPPRPGVQTGFPSSDTVPGLTAAIDAASHPALQICSGSYVSTLAASGDLRGTGTTQYLVDTTCAGATGSSPDEVGIYEQSGGELARTAVVYEFTVNRPRLTALPYVWKDHTVVLTFDDGATYRLVRVLPDTIVPGLVSSFA